MIIKKLMKLIEKIKNFFGFQMPLMEITPERANEIIEKIVDTVSKYDMNLPASIVSAALFPSSTIISQTMILPLAPFFELIGLNGYEYAAFLDNKENMGRVKKRLEQIKKEKDSKGWVW